MMNWLGALVCLYSFWLSPLVLPSLLGYELGTSIRRVEVSDSILQSTMPAVPIADINTPEVQSLIDQMIAVAKGERFDLETPVLVGLAAPQVGVRKQIILVDRGVSYENHMLGELKVYINPEILWSSPEMEEERESCFSVDSHIVGIVSRAKIIKIRAYDRLGKSCEEELSGLTARIFQHEIDHLHGICFPDRVGPEGKLHWVEESKRKEYREHWQNWPVSCPWSVWQAMKKGLPFSSPV